MLRFKNGGFFTYYPTLQNNDSTEENRNQNSHRIMDLSTLATYLSAWFFMKDFFSLFFPIQLWDLNKLSEPSEMKSTPWASFFSLSLEKGFYQNNFRKEFVLISGHCHKMLWI